MKTTKIERTYAGAQQLDRTAYKQNNDTEYRSGPGLDGMRTPYGCIMSAWANADDTMLEHRCRDWHSDEVRSLEWADIFFASLSSVLSESDVSRSTRTWFERRGITC